MLAHVGLAWSREVIGFEPGESGADSSVCAMRKPPQLSLEELLHVRWLIGGGLALLSIGTVFYLDAAIWPVALFATGEFVVNVVHTAAGDDPSRSTEWIQKSRKRLLKHLWDAFDLRLLSLGITLFVADLDFRRARHRLPADQTGLTSGWADSRHFPRGYPPTAMSVTVSATESAFLRRIVGNLTHGKRISAVEFAQRACDHLAQHHGYSLSTSLPSREEGEDPVVRWMRSDGDGHCEFFAGAFVLLSRTAGYPARAVTGFKGGTWNAVPPWCS